MPGRLGEVLLVVPDGDGVGVPILPLPPPGSPHPAEGG